MITCDCRPLKDISLSMFCVSAPDERERRVLDRMEEKKKVWKPGRTVGGTMRNRFIEGTTYRSEIVCRHTEKQLAEKGSL